MHFISSQALSEGRKIRRQSPGFLSEEHGRTDQGLCKGFSQIVTLDDIHDGSVFFSFLFLIAGRTVETGHWTLDTWG